jgi:hypothetical protein
VKAEIAPGSFGQFDVLLDGERVAGKQARGFISRLLRSGDFPEEAEVIQALGSRLRG